MNRTSRFEGCVLGSAIGDALGHPTEFFKQDAIRERYGVGGVTDFESNGHHPRGTYTDDTQMSIAVARALVEAGDRSLDELMAVMGGRFVEWADSPDNDRAPGNTCMAGCRNLAQGVPWREAGVKQSKGCGSAMRAAPIGLYYGHDLDRVVAVAAASSLPTHAHPTAVAAAAGVAVAVALLTSGAEPDQLLEQVLVGTAHLDADCAQKLRQVAEVLDLPPDRALRELGEAWVGEEALADALYCFLRSPGDYRKTVLTAANTNGDSDSIACIAGSFSGAYNGVEAIPHRWRSEVENAGKLASVAQKLERGSRLPAR